MRPWNKRSPRFQENKGKGRGGSCSWAVSAAAWLSARPAAFSNLAFSTPPWERLDLSRLFTLLLCLCWGCFSKKKCGPLVWIGVALALAGLYFLCINESLSIGQGDLFVFICALLFAVHILVIDYFTQQVDGVKMSCIQFFVCGLLSGLGMLLFEKPHLSQIMEAWKPILYAGVLSSGVGYTLQIVGQKGMNPTVASLILSLESVVSVLAGMLLLEQTLSNREILGCVLMFGAIVLAQLPQGKRDSL